MEKLSEIIEFLGWPYERQVQYITSLQTEANLLLQAGNGSGRLREIINEQRVTLVLLCKELDEMNRLRKSVETLTNELVRFNNPKKAI